MEAGTMKPNFFKSAKFIFGTIFIVFAIFLCSLLHEIWPIESKTLAQAGVFGDSFGVLTAFFSALAFGGLMLTIWQQQDEIQFNRNEIKNQNFENSFFRMLETHNILVSGIDIRDKDTHQVKEVGRGCFFVLYEELQEFYNIAPSKTGDLQQIREGYEEFWNK